MLHSKDYEKYVVEDLQKSAGLTRPVKATLPERLLIRKMNINRLHPNPEDEFCMPDIGPNYSIVQKYQMLFMPNSKYAKKDLENAYKEPLFVEKNKPSGYMILNGHHRWLAAHVIHKKRMPIRIVNVTQESDIIKTMSKSQNRICASFDLDEVILVPKDASNVEPRPKSPLSLFYKESVREGVPALIDALRCMGCDIWVYTGQYLSEGYIQTLLRLYQAKPDGVINGMKNRSSSGKIAERFSKRYDVSIHVDAKGIVCVDTKNKTFDTADLVKGDTMWASEAISIIRNMETVKRALSSENQIGSEESL